jgi:hypothetical protein
VSAWDDQVAEAVCHLCGAELPEDAARRLGPPPPERLEEMIATGREIAPSLDEVDRLEWATTFLRLSAAMRLLGGRFVLLCGECAEQAMEEHEEKWT